MQVPSPNPLLTTYVRLTLHLVDLIFELYD